ncbi:MAG: hypothetical protein KAX80_03735 [Planctomycetes bacterium]|nr:hypothetical protein [Planctomycetota bacterium]
MLALLQASSSQPSGLSPFLEVVTAVSIVVAAVVAVYGISSWRREARGKRQMELAEDVLALFYEARDMIMAIRSPFGHSGEGRTRKGRAGETPEQKEVLDQAYVPIERYLVREELFNTLRAKRYRFMAYFGTDKATPFANLEGIARRIIDAARLMARLGMEQAKWQGLRPGDEQLERLTEPIRQQERIIWWQGDEDAIEKELDEIIADIESICGPILCPEERWWDRLS